MQYSDFEKTTEYSLFDYLINASEDLDDLQYENLLERIIEGAENKDFIWQILSKFER